MYMPITVAIIKNTDNTKCCQGCGATGTHTLLVKVKIVYSHSAKQFGSFLQCQRHLPFDSEMSGSGRGPKGIKDDGKNKINKTQKCCRKSFHKTEAITT